MALEEALDIQREGQSIWEKDGSADEVRGGKANRKTDSSRTDSGEKREEGPG